MLFTLKGASVVSSLLATSCSLLGNKGNGDIKLTV